MAINPDNITTIRVDQLATATLNVGNEFAHSQGSELKKATIQDLVDIVSTAVGAGSGVGFLPISVTDGQQLPSVPADPSFFLCGPGTYLNVNGYPDVVCTDELNAVMSLADHWQLSVGIPITPDLPSIGISQSVNSGTIDKAPSENAVYNFVYNYVASQILKSSLGYFDYNDLATQTTPISVPSNTQTLLTNDADGSNTDISQPPFGVTNVWYGGDTANAFDFQQLSIGDTVDIRIHLKTTTSANNQLYHIDMKAGIGSASEFENRIFSAYVKTATVDEQTFVTTFYIGNSDIRDYPTRLFITSVGNTATVEVVGWFVRVFRKSVNIVDIVVAEEAPIDGLVYGRKDAAWFEVTGGGGGSQTLAQTLVLGNTTGGENIEISDGDGVFMDNGSRLIKGVTDAGRGGAKGIALKCSIDYEYKWEAGTLYVLEQDGFTVRETKYNFAITPTATDDSTKGFIVGSRWILDNGDLYICKDATSTAAVWELQIISGGGNSSLTYYLNGSVSQGTIGGNAYKEMNTVPVIGTGTDFAISADGYIAQFLTDVADPNKLIIPAGNWNFETYFSATTAGGTPRFYIELYKYNGATLTLLASNSATPEYITGGTSIDLYLTSLAVPYTVLLATDRLAVRFYVIHSGRTITMHTEDSHLSEVITTFTTGVDSVNGKIGVVVLDTSDISDSVNKRYQTDAQRTVNDATSSIQTQLNGKVNNTGAETISGVKTFTDGIKVGTNSQFNEFAGNAFLINSTAGTIFNVGGGPSSAQNNLAVANGTLNLGLQTASTIASFDASKNIVSLPLATYPSLDELKTVRGITTGVTIQSQIDLRQPYAIARTTTAITFDVPAIYNSFSSPQTGTLTSSLVSPLAKIGVVQVIYLNVATFPTLAGWVNIGSRAFQPSVVNIIYAKWSEGTRVEYWISKATA